MKAVKEIICSDKQYQEALSYRLPMLVEELKIYRNNDSYYVCPRCAITLEREFSSYCDRCGQHLNWSQYKKVKLVFVDIQLKRYV